MKIAVTGASGFVGRYVLRAVAQCEGVDVVAASRTAAGDWLSPGMKHVLLDLATPPQDSFARLGKPDAVIHLAWHGLPNYKSRHHFETHLYEQYRFLRDLVTSGLSSLLCTGTCLEYGMKSGELDESLTPDPKTPYGFAKDALRRELEFLNTSIDFRLTWARLFYMYGDGQSSTSLYSQLVAAGANGDSVFKMSGGEQLRDYLHVADVARLLVSLARIAPGAGIVNVCSGRPTSVRALVEDWIAARRWSMKLALGHFPYAAYEPMAFWGRNARLTQLLEAHCATGTSPHR